MHARGWLTALPGLALLGGLCCGCVVVVSGTPVPTDTQVVSVATRAPTWTPAPPTTTPTAGASATPQTIAIVTATPSETSTPAPDTATPTTTATPTATSSASPTPVPSATATLGPPPNTTAVPIAISLFTISPAQIRPGQAVTLTWQASAQTLTLWRVAADGRLSESFTVPLSGTLTLTVPETQRSRADFALVATAGASSAQAVVSAALLCPADWFFPNGPAECPGGPTRSTAMAAERFERGLMLWTQFDDKIYVLFGDGGQPAWQAAGNAWFEGQPLADPALVPPANFYQPIRGFGLVWRAGATTTNATVRDRLGWATEPEFAISAGLVQCAEAPNSGRCYYTGPAGRVYVLEPQGTAWRIPP